MKTIGLLGFPKETNLELYPDSTVLNKTATNQGTPVCRETLGDILTNMYALLRNAGVTANGNEDNEENGYQILQALKLLANELNDVEQVISSSGGFYTVGLKFSKLPNNYIFIAKANENYNDSILYIKGNEDDSEGLPVTSTGFGIGDEVLVVLNQESAKIIKLNSITGSNNNFTELFTVFGTPIGYSDSGQKIWYKQNGKVFSDLPEIYDLQQAVIDYEENENIFIYDVVLISGNFVCFCYNYLDNKYSFYKFSLNDILTPVRMTPEGFTLGNNDGNIFNCIMFSNLQNIFITNKADCSSKDYIITKLIPNFVTNKMEFAGTVELHSSFVKSSNCVLSLEALYSLINGILTKYDFSGNEPVLLGNFESFNGFLFNIKGSFYYTNGEVAKKWVLQ